MFRAQLEQAPGDGNKVANAVIYIIDWIDLRVRKSLQPTDKTKEKTAEKSKGIAKAKPFPTVNPLQPTTANTTPQATPISAAGSQSFMSKDISDICNDYLQKQSELKPIKPHSPF